MVEYSDDRPLVAPEGPFGFPVLQVDRLDAVVNHALNSENWDQSSWMTMHKNSGTACGTTYCLAGFAAVEFAGLEPIFDESVEPYVDYVDVEGEKRFISEVASGYLGLTSEEAIDLFDSSNEYADVIEITKKIKSGEYR